ncbi:MAG TPA: heme-binding domain-containing protein, partial [Bryobacteraceae bacterium]|nr:heme-binding domain-containing protein [Bryobacteraceae bacterium]
MKKLFQFGLPLLIVALVVLQFFGPETTNPPEDSSATIETIAQPPKAVSAVLDRSCRDCHTNRTTWPWYSRVAPASFLIAQDVRKGRAHLNFSEWRGLPPEITAL